LEARVAMNTILLGVLLAVATVACALGIWAFIEGARSARSLRVLSDHLDASMMPLLEKADITIDALNAELLRVDAIVSRVEEVTERMDSTSRAVQGVANAPAEIVTDIADRVRRAWKHRQAEAAAQAADREQASQQHEEPEPPVHVTSDEGDTASSV
jgi:hypothetical protein